LLLATGGQIAAKSTENLEAACVINEPVEIHPFAFRVHTHRHGEKVRGWVVKASEASEDTEKVDEYLIGERDPQLPELFAPVANKSMVISQNDIVAARCTIKNGENRMIEVGPTGEDEMCNFYLMYWSEGENVLSDNTCFSPGPPEYYWSRNGIGGGQMHHH